MAEEKEKSFSQKIKQIFLAGILASLPLIITIYLLLFLYRLLTGDVIPIVAKIAEKYNYSLSPFVLQFSAFLLVVVAVFLIGIIAKVYVGSLIFKLIDKIVSTIPIARTIYNAVKQVIDSFKSTSSSSFSKVVLIEFPRRDMWMIGFVVKDSQKFISEVALGDEEACNVFIPTAPNPTSGFISIVPKKDLRELDIPVEDGIKFVFSVGVVNLSPESAHKVIKQEIE